MSEKFDKQAAKIAELETDLGTATMMCNVERNCSSMASRAYNELKEEYSSRGRTQDRIRIQFILDHCELYCDGNEVESLQDLDNYIHRHEPEE